MAIVESIPNISEGRRADLIDAIATAVAATPGVRLLDRSSDASHNRTVLTLAGPPAAVREATLTLYAQALDAIDLRQHHGEHPRLGAVDVVPFVPIEGDHDGRLRVAWPGRSPLRLAHASSCRFTSTRRRRPIPRAATSKTSAAANSRGWRRR